MDSAQSHPHHRPRIVQLPPSRIEKCTVCDEKANLRLCSGCAERAYCSVQCQQADWKAHKDECRRTDRIDLAIFWPFLAAIAESMHYHVDKPIHTALRHCVLSDVNPGTHPCKLPDGSAAKLVVLGDETSLAWFDPDSKAWWPRAQSLKVLSKMRRRILREGFALPIAMAVCMSILAEMYTTSTSPGTKDRSVRLRYRSSPIADFGIATGSADVKPQDKLAYWLPDGELMKGQDPDEHYWIYFTTTRGEDVLLDCAMFTFNMCLMVNCAPYLSPKDSPALQFAPGLFRERVLERNTPKVHTERRRVSFLHNEELHRAVYNSTDSYAPEDARRLCLVMDDIAGRKCSATERDLMLKYVICAEEFMIRNIRRGDWRNYPKEPPLAIEKDPGETDDFDDRTTDWAKAMKEWKRSHKKSKHGGVSGLPFDKLEVTPKA